jgi:hypothetical protein
MPDEETEDTKQETPESSLRRWMHSRYRLSAIGGGVLSLLIVGLVVGGLIDTRAPGNLASEARQEAWKFLQPWITQCDSYHYIAFPGSKTQPTTEAYHIVQIKGFELRVDSSPHHAVNWEWRGVVRSRAQKARMFFSETGVWTPWSDWWQLGRVNVSVSLIKWDDKRGKSAMWEVDKSDLASLNKAHAALSCETVAQYLSGAGSGSNGTNNSTVRNILRIQTSQGLVNK